MADDQTVREWARGEGLKVPARGRIGAKLREAFDQAHGASDSGDNPRLSLVQTGEEGAPEAATGEPTAPETGTQPIDTGETRPTPPPGMHRPSSAGRTARVGRPQRARTSLEELAADGWELMGSYVGAQGLVPTGRVLQLQAPIAGMVLEDTLRGTPIDRVLQPLARSREKGGELAALFGPPLIVSILTLKPWMAPKLAPMLKKQLRAWAMVAGPRMKVKEAQERKALKAMGMGDADLDAMVDGWISDLFAPPEDAEMAAEAGADAAAG